MKTTLLTALALAILATGPAHTAGNPIEVGTVDWGRDFDAGLEDAKRTGKPVFAFFQEVPGCSGCQKFGAEVMSHPAIVQAVQDEFIPLLVFNNKPGKDAALLERYGEPAWNYQVIRFLDEKGKDLLPRKERVWTVGALAPRMIQALEARRRDVPKYLEVTALESDTSRHRTAAFAQHCFWRGEAVLGRVPGVVTTEAGWLEGREVTLVRYHVEHVSLESLVEQAAAGNVADKVFLPETDADRRFGEISVGRLDDSYRTADRSDQNRQILDSPFEAVEMSPMQRTKVNAFAPAGTREALEWLTPRQREAFRKLASD